MSIIFSDTGCDIIPEIAEKYQINVMDIPFTIGDKEYYKNPDITLTEFYKKMREGEKVSTSSLNPTLYTEIFEPYLKDGKDVIYIHFSGQMSGTFNQLYTAVNELKEKYPNAQIDIIDSLNISQGGGLLAYEVARRNQEGMPHKELVQWANQNKHKYACFFYVDDLKYLKRGGRISSATAIVGTLLNVKPLLHCANDGKLKVIGKAIGKKKALNELLEYAKKYNKDIVDYPVVILHADALDTAEELKTMFQTTFGPKLKVYINEVGTTVGTHCGPGTIGLFFHGEQLIIN